MLECVRLGGDEFVVVLPGTSAENAVVLLEEVRGHFSNMSVEGIPVALSASVGIAANPPHGTTAEELRRAAGEALMRAKRDGRAEQRDYVRAIRAAPDAATKIARYAAAVTAIAPRLALVLAIVQQAAPDEPELAALWNQIAERRAANMRLFVADLATVHPLRLDADQAANIVWATNAAELYQLLVSQRGWTPQRYERFLTDTWHRLLLAD